MAVRTERQARGWSRDDLAAAAGLSHNAVKNFESGPRWPSWQTLVSLCVALDLVVAVDYAETSSHGKPAQEADAAQCELKSTRRA